MTTKHKIDLSAGMLEVEGSEAFVKEIFVDFKEHSLSKLQPMSTRVEKGERGSSTVSSTRRSGERKAFRNKQKESYALLDINLSDLKRFSEEKSPSNAMEHNAVFVYFLNRIMNLSNISISHIYTCYKFISRKMPGNLKQSLYDTASRKGWINTEDLDNITLTIVGENFVEHDLPKAKKSK